MIELENATKYYPTKAGRKYILQDVTLKIPSNKNVAVIGVNGAGKSTLLRIIGGVELLNQGSLNTEGRVSWPLGLGVGFQGSLTARENIEFVCDISNLPKEKKQQVLEEVEDFCDLGAFFEEPVKTYSSGMKARLSFGLSVSFVFDTYLIDELTAVGDAMFRKKAEVEFAKIVNSPSSVFFVSHNMNTLEQNCNAAIMLHQGNLTYYEDIKEGILAYRRLLKHGK